MASPLVPQLVEDLKSNFYWSYVSQHESNIDTPALEISVEDFLDYIDIDLTGTDPYSENELVTLHYGAKSIIAQPLHKYFTYMIVNSERSILNVIVNLGIIGDSNQFLLLSEASGHSAIGNTPYSTNKAKYTDSEIFSPYINETTIIEDFTNHPLSCSFPKEDFRQFILENWDSGTTSLGNLKLVFEFGATYVSSLNANYKVQTAIILTKDGDGLRLNNTNYSGNPYKFKAMDVGSLCPPHCNN